MKQKDRPFLAALCQASPPTNFGVICRDIKTNKGTRFDTPVEGGINVSHAMGRCVKSQAESYFIRIVFAGQECWVQDLIRELLVGEVGDMWRKYEDRPVSQHKPYTKEWKEVRKGFISRVIQVVLDEHMSRRCRVCNGTKRVARMKKGRVDGQYQTKQIVPMICPSCEGEGIKRYTPEERARKLEIDFALYRRHWHQFAEDIDELFLRYEDNVARKGGYYMWSWD